MKLFVVAAILALALFAGQCRAEKSVEEKKEEYINSVVAEAEKNVSPECFKSIRVGLLEALKETADKYLTKIENGEAFYAKEGKKYNFWRSIKHSLVSKRLVKEGKGCIEEVEKTVTKSLSKIMDKGIDWFKGLFKG